MKKVFWVIVLLLIVSGWGLAASALHVVWTGDRPIVIPKDHVGVRDTYVNVTKWSPDDVPNHAPVVNRLVQTGHADALASVFKAKDSDDLKTQIADAIAKGPTTQPATVKEQIDQVAKKTADKMGHVVEDVKAKVGH